MEKYIGYELPSFDASYNQRDAIIYALSIGCTELQYIYELADNFQVLPSFLCILPFKGNIYMYIYNINSPSFVLPYNA